jgi:hypothetical protein
MSLPLTKVVLTHEDQTLGLQKGPASLPENAWPGWPNGRSKPKVAPSRNLPTPGQSER